ncbi:hypothetical protein [Massilia sp. TN1-12]|uniref:hypothetical protein n=1 Tax=Massilia paldalensis TaxID=3377675 RepID=UPI0038506946
MALETGTYISDFVITNPTPGDPKSQGDDHLRLIKTVLKASFPNFSGPMTVAHDRVASIDYVNQTAFSSALPGQPGGALTYEIVSQNGAANWRRNDINSSSERLAQVQAAALSFGI